jgi:SAM-dependent methyltransferase
VLDLAAGTGKLTGALLGHAGRVVAVEPSEPMLDALRARLPEVEALAGTAEAIPLADGEADAVVVGEAFHWFETRTATREIARVLRPGGWLGLLWNRERWDEAELPWLDAFSMLVAPYRRAAGAFPVDDEATWKREVAATGVFRRFERFDVDHVHRVGPEAFLALVSSWTWIATLPEPRRGAVLAAVEDIAMRAGELALPYRTEVQWARRR